MCDGKDYDRSAIQHMSHTSKTIETEDLSQLSESGGSLNNGPETTSTSFGIPIERATHLGLLLGPGYMGSAIPSDFSHYIQK